MRDALRRLERFLDEALDAPIDLIQIRERDLDARPMIGLVRRLVRRAEGRPCRIVVNDRVDVALAAGAHGVHLPGHGLPIGRVRPLVPGRLIGRSVHAGDRVGGPDEADYLVFGTVAPTASKAGTPIAGLAGLRAAVAAAGDVPVLAIGGMSPVLARSCAEAGAAGVAAIGLFLPPDGVSGAMGVGRAARALRDALAGGSA